MGGTAIEISDRYPPRPRLLMAFGFALLALVGTRGEVTALTHAVSVALGLVAGWLAWSGWPRPRRIEIDPNQGTLEADGRRHLLSNVRHIELRARSGELLGRARASYTAELVLQDERRVALFECGDPGNLLRLAAQMVPVIPVLVVWCSPSMPLEEWRRGRKDTISSSEDSTRSPSAPSRTLSGEPGRARTFVAHAYARRRKAAAITLAVAVAIGITWTAFLIEAPHPPGAFSIGLAVGTVAFVLATSVLITFDTTRITCDDVLQVERRLVGFRVTHFVIPMQELERVEALSPDGEAGYLLLATSAICRALPLAEPEVSAVANALKT